MRTVQSFLTKCRNYLLGMLEVFSAEKSTPRQSLVWDEVQSFNEESQQVDKIVIDHRSNDPYEEVQWNPAGQGRARKSGAKWVSGKQLVSCGVPSYPYGDSPPRLQMHSTSVVLDKQRLQTRAMRKRCCAQQQPHQYTLHNFDSNQRNYFS